MRAHTRACKHGTSTWARVDVCHVLGCVCVCDVGETLGGGLRARETHGRITHRLELLARARSYTNTYTTHKYTHTHTHTPQTHTLSHYMYGGRVCVKVLWC